MNPEQMNRHNGEWCRLMYRSRDGEAVTNPKAMPRGYSHTEDYGGMWRFTTGGPTGGWELFLTPEEVISVTPIPKESDNE